MESQPRSLAGRALVYLLVGAILAGAVAVFMRNLDAFIDAVHFYVNIPLTYSLLGVVLVIALLFWLRGCQLYARSKGRSAVIGIALGLIIVGPFILAALPARKPAQEAEPAPPEEGASPAESEATQP